MGTGPDPKTARTPAEFVALMRQLRTWADLSYRQVERNATQAGDVLPRATISGALARTDLPREELLAAFVRACGGDSTTVDTWLTARRELAISTDPTAPAGTQGAPELGTAHQTHQGHENTPAGPPPPPPAATPPPDAQSHPHTPKDEPSKNEGDSTSPVTGPQPLAPTPEEPTPQHQQPPPPGQDTRPRYLPMTLTGAAAAVGILLIAFWPHGDKPTTTQPETSPSTSTTLPNTTPPATPSTTPSSPTPSPSPEPVQAEAEKTTDTPTTRPAPQPTPTPRKTSVPPQAPETGTVQIHPSSDAALCLTEGRERNGRTDREIAVQSPCAQAGMPTVSLASAGSQTYRIHWDHPAHGVGCLTVDNASTSPGALLAPAPAPVPPARNTASNLPAPATGSAPSTAVCASASSPPRTTGAEAIQQTCTGTDDQVFRLTNP
ncbi:helix-turn-helix domain-containing protein [Streptomyces sp. NPDC015501]|uniref:helix-turn-helix domain-containing protein n=1 Tax=unclassified Streptomyces TaxID=2593676 RepID=UPI0011A9005E